MTLIALSLQGQTWETWERLSLRRSLDDIVHSLSAQTSDPNRYGPATWDLRNGAEIALTLDNETLFAGFISDYETSKRAGTVSINALNRANDLVECGHEGPYFWQSTTGDQVIADVLQKYGFEYRIEADLQPIPEEGFRVAVDATAYQILRRVAERAGAVIWSDRTGLIRIDAGVDDTVIQPLGPCDYSEIRLTGNLDVEYSHIIIKYQANDFKSSDDATQSAQVTAINDSAARYRPLVIIETSKDAARERLGDYITRRVTGETLDVAIDVHSHRRPDGLIWEPGQLIDLEDDVLNIRDRLVVHTVDLEIGESGGLINRIMARTPQSYTGEVTATDKRRAEAFAPVANALSEFEVI